MKIYNNYSPYKNNFYRASQPISGNVVKNDSTTNANVAFKGATGFLEGIINPISKKLNSFYKTVGEKALTPLIGKPKPQKVISHMSLDENFYTHLSVASSIVLSGFYMLNTYKNKDIKQDQKTPLMINQGLVAAVSAFGTYAINGFLNESVDNLMNAFESEVKVVLSEENLKKTYTDPKKYAEFIEKKHNQISQLSNFGKGLKIIQSMLVFSVIYRFISPVFVTPLANRISASLKENNQEKTEKVATKK